MDPETASFQPRDDYWRLQNEMLHGQMLHIQQGQTDLNDRVSRLERRNEEDSQLKNGWGTSSPFPSVLGGTPQQGNSLHSHLPFVCVLIYLSPHPAAHRRALLQLRRRLKQSY